MIYLYTGNGAGKTTAALGLALRAIGQGHRVIIIQFMKGRKDIGEWKIRKRLGKNYEIYQFGRKGWVDLKKPAEKDRLLAGRGLEFAWKVLKAGPDMLILDEINLAASTGLLDRKEVIRLLKAAPKKTTVVLTGRNAPREFMKAAEFVNEVVDRKHPRRLVATKGVQY